MTRAVFASSIGANLCADAALRQNDDSPIQQLDLRHSRLDSDTEKFLIEIASSRFPPLDLKI